MKQSPLLHFESSAFPVATNEDTETNPGIHGKSLAMWLSEELRKVGRPAGSVFAEDFGWCVPIESSPHKLYVTCSSGGKANEWQVFAFAEGGFMARVLGRDKSAESVASLFTAVRRCIESVPDVRNLSEEAG
jgi:hypothetical protein